MGSTGDCVEMQKTDGGVRQGVRSVVFPVEDPFNTRECNCRYGEDRSEGSLDADEGHRG